MLLSCQGSQNILGSGPMHTFLGVNPSKLSGTYFQVKMCGIQLHSKFCAQLLGSKGLLSSKHAEDQLTCLSDITVVAVRFYAFDILL